MGNRESNKRFSHGSKHHVVPRSRGGPDEWNIYWWHGKDHRAWHILFGNLMPSVCTLTILDLTDDAGQLIEHKLNKKKLGAWERLFNRSDLAKIIAIINEKGFLSIERRFLKGKGFITPGGEWILQSEFNEKQEILWRKIFDDVPMEKIAAVHSNQGELLRDLKKTGPFSFGYFIAKII